MSIYECYVKIPDSGTIIIPQEIKRKLKKDCLIKLVIFPQEEEKKYMEAVTELNGLLSDLPEEDIKKFDRTLNDRINFKRNMVDL